MYNKLLKLHTMVKSFKKSVCELIKNNRCKTDFWEYVKFFTLSISPALGDGQRPNRNNSK